MGKFILLLLIISISINGEVLTLSQVKQLALENNLGLKAEQEATYSASLSALNAKFELGNLFEKLLVTAKSIKSSELAMKYAEESYEQSAERFKTNMITATELLDVQLLLSSTAQDYYSSYYNFFQTRTFLLKELGTKDENILWTIINSVN